MLIRKIFPQELDWANAQYSTIKFKLSSDADFVALAELDGIRVGLGRLTFVDSTIGELGGMFVLPEYRGRKIAENIVSFLLENSSFSCLYCIPFAHLERFYEQFGFVRVCEPVVAPELVVDKFSWCAEVYESPVVLMKRG